MENKDDWGYTKAFDNILKSGKLFLVTGEARRHFLVCMAWAASTFHGDGPETEVLTNLVFKKKQKDGNFLLDYPPRVTFCNSLLDIVLQTARIINEGRKVLVVMDNSESLFCKGNSPLVRDFIVYLETSTVLRQTFMFSAALEKKFPQDLCLAAAHIYDSMNVDHLEHNEFGLEPWVLSACPWTRDPDSVGRGATVVDFLSPSSLMRIGNISDYSFNFRDIIEKCEHSISESIPGRLDQYITEIDGYKRYTEMRRRSLVQEGRKPDATQALLERRQQDVKAYIQILNNNVMDLSFRKKVTGQMKVSDLARIDLARAEKMSGATAAKREVRESGLIHHLDSSKRFFITTSNGFFIRKW